MRVRAFTVLAIAFVASACQTSSQPQIPPVALGDGPVTFNNPIVRLFQRHCQACHRPGEVAPFSLTGYREAHGRRADILDAVRARKMPPWKAVPGRARAPSVSALQLHRRRRRSA